MCVCGLEEEGEGGEGEVRRGMFLGGDCEGV